MKFWKSSILVSGAATALVVIAVTGWDQWNDADRSTSEEGAPPQMASSKGSGPLNGKGLYQDNCASCHGLTANGTETGPPFLHRVYVPSHHSDEAFLLAVKRGVRAHHWTFGDMPPQPAVSEAQAKAITTYIRQLQRMVGLQ